MNSIASHVEYLLRKHDCVVLPGLGALLCRYVPASFADEDGVTLNPPGRFMAFNGMLTESDGMLASSVARQSGVTFEAATRSVEAEVAQMRAQLALHGDLQLGRLGLSRLNPTKSPASTAISSVCVLSRCARLPCSTVRLRLKWPNRCSPYISPNRARATHGEPTPPVSPPHWPCSSRWDCIACRR